MCLAITRIYHTGDYASIITASASADEKLCSEISEDFARYVRQGLSVKPDDRPNVGNMLECFQNSLQTN